VLLALLLAAQSSTDCAASIRLGQAGDLVGAEPKLTACIDSPTAPLDAFLLLAGIHQSTGNAEALERVVLRGIKRFPAEKRFYLTAGVAAGRARRFDDAIRVLGEADRRWPADPQIQPLLASAYFGRGTAALDRGESEKAAADLGRAVELSPGDAEALMNLGRAQHNLTRYEAAVKSFDRVFAIQPSAPLLRFHRGLAYYSLGQFDAAIADLNAQLEADRSYAPAVLVRGLAYLAKGDDAAATADLKSAATVMADDAAAQFGYARVLVRSGKLEEAESRLRAAMKIDADDPGPVNLLVTVLNRLGRGEEARPLAVQAAELAKKRRSAGPGEIRFGRGMR
jgi:tetratricopeptide (TPR) repeat protein